MTHDLIPVTRHHGLTLPALFAPDAPAAAGFPAWCAARGLGQFRDLQPVT